MNATNTVLGCYCIFDRLSPKKKSKSNLPTAFNDDDKEISDPTQIADHFRAYFTKIGGT